MRSQSHNEDDGLLSHSRMDWYHEMYLAGQPVTPYAAPLTSPDLSRLRPALILSAGHDPLRHDAEQDDLRRQGPDHPRRVEEIYDEVLTRLERDGLVRRTVHPVVPPRVDYDLTPLGATLLDAIEPLVAWTREHRDTIGTAIQRLDSAKGFVDESTSVLGELGAHTERITSGVSLRYASVPAASNAS